MSLVFGGISRIKPARNAMKPSFAGTYPNIVRFGADIGTIEVGYGHDGYVTSFRRALDEGGMVWEGEDDYPTLNAALVA